MMNKPIASILVTLLALLTVELAVASPAALRQVPLPPNTRIALVGENLKHNGSLVSIATFDSDESVDTVLAYYRGIWPHEDDLPGHVEHTLNGWRVLSRLRDSTNLVLQLQAADNGGARGLLSAMDIGEGTPNAVALRMPPGSELLSSTDSSDGRRKANTWLLRSPARIGEVVSFYIDHFERQGWSLLTQRTSGESSIVLMSHREGSLEITASRDSAGTFVVVNRVWGAS